MRELLEQQDLESELILKPEITEALLNSFLKIASRFSGLDVDGVKRTSDLSEENDPLDQILQVFRAEKIWPKSTRAGPLHTALFHKKVGNP